MPTRKVGVRRLSSSSSSSSDNPPAPPPEKYALTCASREGHGRPIYCVAFSRHVHAPSSSSGEDDDNDDGAGGKVSLFATCGGPYATIYEVVDDARVGQSSSSTSSSIMTARQVYRDVDDGETFYTCAFGGRGYGRPLARRDDIANTNGTVRFGMDEDFDVDLVRRRVRRLLDHAVPADGRQGAVDRGLQLPEEAGVKAGLFYTSGF